MRILCASVATMALGLATCLSASAQVENRNQNRNANDRNQSNQGETRVIRGVVAGITVAGETAIDLRTNRAVMVEASYLTIVGSEENQGGQRDRDEADRKNDQNDRNARDASDRQASSDRHRHNIYMVWMTPRTDVRLANARRGDGDRDAQNNDQRNQNANATANANAAPVSFENLEVGDRVEVRFNPRSTASETQSTANRRHGRHRTYYGDATAITILAEPARNDRNRDANRDRDRDRDRDQNNQENDRNK
jgi:hypothetical protein